ncbi:unnamed protein product [Pleuronectes platessa]|uniref:Uncharacterized protein n=1 Tax=Pleuronectes platessa TaxID=8262 RepID=A0A9N7YLU5_PLEPL|nr:unnamed protein product [Pleuronectes platessa]
MAADLRPVVEMTVSHIKRPEPPTHMGTDTQSAGLEIHPGGPAECTVRHTAYCFTIKESEHMCPPLSSSPLDCNSGTGFINANTSHWLLIFNMNWRLPLSQRQ